MRNVILSLAVVLLLVVGASASAISELGDAGNTLATAQVVPGGVDTILGATGSGDADLYRFFWGGGGFYVNTVGSPFDTQLFLFNGSGVGVQANDDGIAYAGPSYLQLGALAAGTYYLGISGYNLDPFSADGSMFTSWDPSCVPNAWACLSGPLNLSPLAYWALNPIGDQYEATGSYVINFRQTTQDGQPIGDPNPTGEEVPEPATLLLMGSGLLALASRLRIHR